MLDFLFDHANLPFVLALALMLGLGVVELASLLMGSSFGSLTDSGPDVDVDFDLDPGLDVDVHADVDLPDVDLPDMHADINTDVATQLDSHHGIDASGSILQSALAWLHLGRLPLMIIMVLALFSFGGTGLLLQSIFSTSTGHLLPSILASIPAFIVMILFVRFAGLGLLKVMPQDETQAVHSRSFVGKEAMMVIGVATAGRPAQAKVRDEYNQTHYIMVQPRDQGVTLTPGMRILIISKHKNEFKAIVHPLAPISNSDGDAITSK